MPKTATSGGETTIASASKNGVNPKSDEKMVTLPALENITLEGLVWSSSGGVMMVGFVAKNDSDVDIKDFEVTCRHAANSGTIIDSNTRTVYEVVKAHKKKNIRGFSMGFINSQAVRSGCTITNWTMIP